MTMTTMPMNALAFDLDARLRLLPLLCRAALPTQPSKALCARAVALHGLAASECRERLAGLPDFDLPRFDALPAIASALEACEADLDARHLALGPVVTRLCDEAVALRRQFVREARYFLRRNPGLLRQLGDLTHERSIEALTLDLGHIAQMATLHESALRRSTMLPTNLAATAQRLACALCLHLCEDNRAPAVIQERRNALFWLLSDAFDELEAALAYLDPEEVIESARGEADECPANPNLLFEHRAASMPSLEWAMSQAGVSDRGCMRWGIAQNLSDQSR
ncbi:MAG: hypothetical protein LBM75_06470 [Myxococcales bacterium]|jgi:hypothetical protein|nr:hypothetical protein [Myxococcales bacterium]